MLALFANSKNAPSDDWLDIRTRIFISLICSMVAILLKTVAPILVLGLVTLLYVLQTRRVALLAVVYLLIVALTALSLGTVWLFFGGLEWVLLHNGSEFAAMAGRFKSQILASFHIPFLRLIPSINVLLALSLTVHLQRFINAMKMLRLPRIIYLPLTVFCRFVPEFIQNVRQLREAVLLRGLSVSFGSLFLHPVHSLRLTLVPLVVRTFRMADNLAVAAEMKRIGYIKQPTMLAPLAFRKTDFVAMTATVLISAALVIWHFIVQPAATMGPGAGL